MENNTHGSGTSITTSQASQIFNVTKATLERWRAENIGPQPRLEGRRFLYERAAMEEFFRQKLTPADIQTMIRAGNQMEIVKHFHGEPGEIWSLAARWPNGIEVGRNGAIFDPANGGKIYWNQLEWLGVRLGLDIAKNYNQLAVFARGILAGKVEPK